LASGAADTLTSGVAETAFRIVYEGPALKSGRMAAPDLAPALLALGELFTEVEERVAPEVWCTAIWPLARVRLQCFLEYRTVIVPVTS
jgi:hypothetical protein